MFIDLSKDLRDEKKSPFSLHTKRTIIKKSCFYDHNDSTKCRESVDHRVQPLTPEQIRIMTENLKNS